MYFYYVGTRDAITVKDTLGRRSTCMAICIEQEYLGSYTLNLDSLSNPNKISCILNAFYGTLILF